MKRSSLPFDYSALIIIGSLVVTFVSVYIFFRLNTSSKPPPIEAFPSPYVAQTTVSPSVTPFPIISTADEKIVSSILQTSCQVTVTTTRQKLSFSPVVNQQLKPTDKCALKSFGEISPSKQFVAFEDQLGSQETLISTYFLKYGQPAVLDNYSTAAIPDMVFTPANLLLTLHGTAQQFDSYTLSVYDLPNIEKNLASLSNPKSTASPKSYYLHHVSLPDIGKDYTQISTTTDSVILKDKSGLTLRVFTYTELLPQSACSCWSNTDKACSTKKTCPTIDPRLPNP